jgi:protein O-GlcNAc transferase
MRSPAELLREAEQLHRRGDLTQAEILYRQVLESPAERAGALHYLGVIAYQRGQCAQAVQLIREAIALDGNQAAFHNNLGLALRALRRSHLPRDAGEEVDEAQAAYHRALELRPDYPDALSNLASRTLIEVTWPGLWRATSGRCSCRRGMWTRCTTAATR